MSDSSHNMVIRSGTIGGIFSVLLANINTTDVLKTAVLGCVGAVVSYGTSVLMKQMLKWWIKVRMRK